VAAAVMRFFYSLPGPAAACIAKFQGGRAFIPVTAAAWAVAVLFSTCTGVRDGGFVFGF